MASIRTRSPTRLKGGRFRQFGPACCLGRRARQAKFVAGPSDPEQDTQMPNLISATRDGIGLPDWSELRIWPGDTKRNDRVRSSSHSTSQVMK